MPTKFNPENKESLTVGEALNPAMEITDQDEADAYLKDYVALLQKLIDKKPSGPSTAMDVARINIGYYACYFGEETQERVKKLFLAEHSIFDKPKA